MVNGLTMAIFVLAVSTLLQFTAALLAGRLILLSKNGLGWSLIAAALFLMAARRSVSLYQSTLATPATHPSLQAEIIALGISLLMVIGVLGIGRLFRKLQAHENQLSLSEDRLLFAQRSAELGNWEYDLSADTLWWSDEIYKIFGLAKNATPVTYRTFRNVLHPEDRDAVIRQVQTSLDSKTDYRFDHRIVRPDGSVRVVAEAARTVLDDDGRVTGLRGTVQDITDRKKGEEELARTVKRLEVNVDRLNRSQTIARLGNWDFDPKNQTVWWSDEVYRLVGMTPGDEVLDFEEVLELCVPEQRETMHAATVKAIKTGKPYSFEHDLIRKDGTRITVHEQGEIIFGNDGKVLMMAGTVQDITDRLKAAEVLRLTQERLGTLSRLSPVGIYHTDRDGKCLYVNDKWCELSGLTTEQSLGLGWSDAINLEDRPKILHSWAEATERTQPFSMEFRILRPDGTTRWVVGQAAAQLDGSGRFEGFIGAVTDITDQKTMQDALRTSEERLATAHKISSLGFYEWDMLTNSATWSPEVDEVFGFPFNEIANTREKYIELIHPDDVQTWREAMGGRENSPEPVSSEYRLILPDGSARNVLGVGQIIKGKEGAPVRLTGTLQDITALRRTEASLRQITAEQRVILDHAQIGIAFIKNRRVVRSNDRLAIMLGRFPEGLDNARIDEFFGGENETVRFWVEADSAFRIGLPHEAELLVRREDDSKAWIRVIGNAVNPTNPSEGSIWLAENVTRRKSAEDALRQSQKMDAVGQLSGGIAHDFNNLLGIIIGNLEILEQMPGMQETDRAWAERAKEAALRGADLTSRLLKFSSGAGKKRQLMVLNDAIVGMDNMLSRSLTTEIQIQTELAADLWLTELELSDLENAIVNLAINARDAMPVGGALRIETANITLDANSNRLDIDVPLGDYVLLTVSDTGTGMPADVIARAFDPFFTTKDQDKGTGLGLSMVYGFVDRSSGHIRIRSRLNEGTTFRMYFPRVNDLTAFGPTLATQTKTDLPQGKEVVLVVDDEVSLSAPTAAQLTKLGYQVLTADSGPAALEVLRGDQKIDLIVSDVVMPGKINGYDLARQAKKQFSDIGIILTSGYTSRATLERAGEQEGGDFPFIAKPYEFEALALKIREVLGDPKP